jgi:tripartite-type tricarboxylate transporter receptor subunit TctC
MMDGLERSPDGMIMSLARRQFLQAAAGAAFSMPFARVATAQAYPSRSVRVVVPVGAGGANDTSTRLIAQKLPRASSSSSMSRTSSARAAILAWDRR